MEVRTAKSAGFCFGVKRAVDKAYELAEHKEKAIYTLGPIIHNEEVIADLEKKGVFVAESPEQIPDPKNSIVIIRSHGVGKAVASWGAVAVHGVLNWFSNKDEQASSNGTMSDGRVIAETITETAIDTALTYGTGIVVGAAVTATLGTVAAPGIVVVAASGAIVAGLNAGVKALTGKTTTEWISDTILDTGEAIGNAVSNVAKNVSVSTGSWFGKLSFT